MRFRHVSILLMRSRGAIEPTKENGVAIPEAADAPPAIAA